MHESVGDFWLTGSRTAVFDIPRMLDDDDIWLLPFVFCNNFYIIVLEYQRKRGTETHLEDE